MTTHVESQLKGGMQLHYSLYDYTIHDGFIDVWIAQKLSDRAVLKGLAVGSQPYELASSAGTAITGNLRDTTGRPRIFFLDH